MQGKERTFTPEVEKVWNKDYQCEYYRGVIIDGEDITAELSVYVKNDCQNRHIGTQLIEYALQEAQKNNRFLTVVSLITSENEHSIYLHKQFGFQFGGRIKNAGFKFDRLLGVDIYYKNFQ